MRRAHRISGVMLALSLFVSGCYGPFRLTRQLHDWNGRIGDKYENEVVFVAFCVFPVYAFTAAADAVLFNSIEFWTGRRLFVSFRDTSRQSARLIQQALQPKTEVESFTP